MPGYTPFVVCGWQFRTAHMRVRLPRWRPSPLGGYCPTCWPSNMGVAMCNLLPESDPKTEPSIEHFVFLGEAAW